jgi:hypothetical protein
LAFLGNVFGVEKSLLDKYCWLVAIN